MVPRSLLLDAGAEDRRYKVQLTALTDNTLKSLLHEGIPVIARVVDGHVTRSDS